MKAQYLIVLGGLFGGCLYAAQTDVVAPGGIWWKPKSRIIIDRPVSLTAASIWVADEIVVRQPVVSNGQILTIQTRSLSIAGDGKFIGFDRPAADAQLEGPAHNSAADTGASPSGQGKNGAAGKKGFTGGTGMGSPGSDSWPGQISIFAAQVRGALKIDGSGQNGGSGGKGGRGQDGGAGGAGRQAECRKFRENISATVGGDGGSFGPGGTGGDGGQGGIPVPIRLLTAGEFETKSALPVLISLPGKGGNGGVGGDPGNPGKGGVGSPDSVCTVWFFGEHEVEREYGSADGKDGEKCSFATGSAEARSKCSSGQGFSGKAGVIPSSTVMQQKIGRSTLTVQTTHSDLEAHRYKVASRWFDFHWWRLFEQITHSSLLLLANTEGEEPLKELLGAALPKARISNVRQSWELSFLKPLERELAHSKTMSVQDKDLLTDVKAFVSILASAESRGALTAEEILKLGEFRKQASERRSVSVRSSIEECESYLPRLLKDAKDDSDLLAAHFEVPACIDAKGFQTAEGVIRPIILARDFDARIVPAISETAVEYVAPDLKQESTLIRIQKVIFSLFSPVLSLAISQDAFADERIFTVSPVALPERRLTEDQLRDFIPRIHSSTKVTGLGVHKGFVMPSEAITLDTLSKSLRSLAKTKWSGRR